MKPSITAVLNDTIHMVSLIRADIAAGNIAVSDELDERIRGLADVAQDVLADVYDADYTKRYGT